MSRASNLRDAVVQAIADGLPGQRVDSTVVANYSPEDLPEPVVAVRVNTRGISVEMGPDERTIDITVLVLNRVPDATGFPTDARGDYRQAEVIANDENDSLVESIIGLWSPATELSKTTLAGHRFNSITQETVVDVASYFENGIWYSALSLNFYDYHDEDE